MATRCGLRLVRQPITRAGRQRLHVLQQFWPIADGPLCGAECGKADVGSGGRRGSYRHKSVLGRT
jgi:hypothetical protein